jgi:hypothetical protein
MTKKGGRNGKWRPSGGFEKTKRGSSGGHHGRPQLHKGPLADQAVPRKNRPSNRQRKARAKQQALVWDENGPDDQWRPVHYPEPIYEEEEDYDDDEVMVVAPRVARQTQQPSRQLRVPRAAQPAPAAPRGPGVTCPLCGERAGWEAEIQYLKNWNRNKAGKKACPVCWKEEQAAYILKEGCDNISWVTRALRETLMLTQNPGHEDGSVEEAKAAFLENDEALNHLQSLKEAIARIEHGLDLEL